MCQQCKKPYYITTAIAYTSGRPHIGNTYEIILADSIARYKRQLGYDVYFQTGTDEHGQKIEDKAKEAGVSPQEFVDVIAGQIQSNWDLMNTSYDRFVRTTDETHKKQVQKIFKKLFDQGDIYQGFYEGLYCKPCESFWTSSQLVDAKCPDCGGPVEPAKEDAYFFKLSKYQDRLMKHIEENPHFIQPESRKNEMINNFLKPGLLDLCVSRTSFKWGIPVDLDPNHVVYVWIDALANYITNIGYDADGNHSEMFKKYWPADVHLIGKDILRFHTLYWPNILMALDIELPKQVFGHPWLLVGEGKMSKSKGNVIYAEDLVKTFGVDAVRYFSLHEMPFGNDGVITWDLMIERFNSDLANVLGNLVNRTISMSNKYFGGTVNNPKVSDALPNEVGVSYDEELIGLAMSTAKKVQDKMEYLRVSDAISEIFELFRRCNKYIDETLPWALAKDETKQDRLQTVLYNLLESIRIGAIVLKPYMPATADNILHQLNTNQVDYDSIEHFGGLASGTKVVEKPEILFARLDAKEILDQIELEKGQQARSDDKQEKESNKPNQLGDIPKEEISFEDFTKVQLKVGTIEACEKHPKADKLLVSQVNIGNEVRQIVSGIAQSFEPADLLGKKVIVVANLKSANLRGVESQGMVLAASLSGNLDLVTILKDLPNGTEVK